MNIDPSEVRVRPYDETDLELLRALLGDAEMTRFIGGPETDEAIVARHERYLASAPDASGLFTVHVGETPVGWVGFWESSWGGSVQWECGWHVVGGYQRQGVASIATRRVLDEARARHRYRFVDAFPAVANAASNALCRSLGFLDLGQEDVEYPKGQTMRARHWRYDLER